MLLTPLVTDLLHRSDCPRPRYFQKSLADNLRSEFGTDGFARERNTSGAATEIVRNEWVEQATGGAEVLSLMAAGNNEPSLPRPGTVFVFVAGLGLAQRYIRAYFSFVRPHCGGYGARPELASLTNL